MEARRVQEEAEKHARMLKETGGMDALQRFNVRIMQLLNSFEEDELFALMANPDVVPVKDKKGRSSVVARSSVTMAMANGSIESVGEGDPEEIDPVEFDTIVEMLMPEDFSTEEKCELFAVFDSDGGGTISRDEFKEHVRKVIQATEIEQPADGPDDVTREATRGKLANRSSSLHQVR